VRRLPVSSGLEVPRFRLFASMDWTGLEVAFSEGIASLSLDRSKKSVAGLAGFVNIWSM